ncbi:MAG: hypothetical protein IPM29_17780 [Planctomycetes bacterium]|nr:hypothetical protein [Planctomycetota bacterium]
MTDHRWLAALTAGALSVACPADTNLPAATALPLPQVQSPDPIALPAPQRPAKGGPVAAAALAAAFDPARVLVDDAGAGGLWAAAGSYKARFAAGAATFVPYLGARAARDWPLTLRLRRVTVAGATVATSEPRLGRPGADCVAFDRGPVVERHWLRSDGIEQTFEIRELPERGELCVEVACETELAVLPDGGGFLFRGPEGGVRMSGAVAIDAGGRREALRSELRDGAIVHHVSAGFVAEAALPIVVDPVLSTFSIASSTFAFGAPDLAFESGSGMFLLVCERRYSLTDTDVWCELRDDAGAPVAGSGQWIDVSTDDWRKPQVAANRAAGRFLVVAETLTVGGSFTTIRGRTRDAGGATQLQAPFSISNALTNHSVDPDVGGDGNPFGPDYWAVVWEDVRSASDSDILYRMIRDDGTSTTPAPLALENSTSLEQRPRISKSNGSSPATTQSWMVVFTRRISPTTSAVLGANLSWDGRITHPTYPVGPNRHAMEFLVPDVSSATEVVQGRRQHLVVAQQSVSPTEDDLWIDLVADGQWLAGQNISTRYAAPQVAPVVDTDGVRFAIAFGQLFSAATNDYDVYVTTVHTVQTPALGLGFTETQLGVGLQFHWEGAPAVAARLDGNGGRYLLAWEDSNAGGPATVRGAVYEGLGTGGFTTLPYGCHGFPITATGDPRLGARVSFQVPGPTTGPTTSGTLFGIVRAVPVAIPMCSVPCTLGVEGPAFPPLIHVDIPIDGALVGLRAAVQGFDLTGGSCLGLGLRLSDTIVITVR